MSKNLLIGTIIVGIIILVGVVFFVTHPDILSKNETNTLQKVERNESGVSNQNEVENTEQIIGNIIDTDNTVAQPTTSTGNKILVVYYSAQTHTKAVAEKIADNLKADIFEIVPQQIYTSDDLDWTNNNSRVSKEHSNESLRDVKLITTEVANWNEYNTVLIGYPIWWGIAAWPVDSLVKANDFNDKTVIPFCTSSSSSLGQSGNLLKQKANSGNWLEGHRFSSNPSDSDIKNWTDSLN